MRGILVVLSGGMGAGKSFIASTLSREFPNKSFCVKSTSTFIKESVGNGIDDRNELQNLGHGLDDANPEWIAEAARSDRWVTVLDCARSLWQINLLRKRFPNHKVIHVHVFASLETRIERRPQLLDVSLDRLESKENLNELEKCADLVVSSDAPGINAIFQTIRSHKRVDAIIGGQYGSEGKGHIVSYLAREYELVVRSGGPNAGHKVNHRGRVFTFFHIPSAALHSPDSLCYIAGSAIINPVKLIKELHDLRELMDGAMPNLKISPNAFLVEPEDIELESSTIKGGIGSTAQGVGAALSRRIMRGTNYRTTKDVPELHPYIGEVDVHSFKSALLEGTQGYGLDVHHGDYPFTTSRATGSAGLLAEIGISPGDLCQSWAVFRTYPIRVQSPDGGTSGYMLDEIDLKTIHDRSGVNMDELEATETTSTTFRRRRIAEFDVDLFNKTIKRNGITHVALTFLDYFGIGNRKARKVSDLNEDAQEFLDYLKNHNVSPALLSCGFDHNLIIDDRG